jgi:S-adenosylmethionine synthetase
MMFGYACDETPERLPLPIALAHRLVRRHGERRAARGELGPDAKAQVTVDYARDVPRRLHTVVLSTQHAPALALDDLRELVRSEIVAPVLGDWLAPDTRVLVNPAGTFHQGGPAADAGLTGRKIIVDSYGGMAPHGGGAFSGKDPTKVDRSAAYAARQLARAVVDRFGARSCTVRVAYAIGERDPIALALHTTEAGTPLAADLDARLGELAALFRPGAIIRRLDLRRPIYLPTAAGGHFGRDGLPWEVDDLGDALPHPR